MLNGAFSKSKNVSLMSEYASLLGDAVLRDRTRTAEHSARIESDIAAKVKSEFIANMSHELRTPLNTVIGFSKILAEHGQRRLDDNDIVEYARLISDAAIHLLTVINDVLDISKIQSGRYTLESCPVHVDKILTNTLQSVETLQQKAGVTIDFAPPASLPEIHGDADKLGQVFLNLLSNAIKFTRKGGTISIETEVHIDNSVRVSIRDTGIGMTEEEIHLALTPFGQVDGTRARWREGTGLGLPIAKALVELHGGRLNIHSRKGQGTEVAIELPSCEQVTVSQARDTVLGQGAAI